ncbi:Dor1-like family-domain-containing protein [Hygrophoropsis aurantiaca]|uniref:Dor1-like family-domain-containing protein n=1 Tax=Hygrophoropsis aurantiaca TaxID=72124 RepID=A0ACB8ARH4_9AGAM|nr:Dor1-like family-domain-containing protein [Hygrophoropsis aurantiaca]
MTTTAQRSPKELSSLTEILPSPSSSQLSSDPANVAYLTELPSYTLSDLLSTPTTLTTQSHTLTSSLTALTHTSYPTFLSLHRTSTALLSSLSSLDVSLGALLNTALPALDNAARVFRERSGPGVIDERQKARVVLEQHDKLKDLLDTPVLIDTCVRNGHYAEALALATHASSALNALSTSASNDSNSEPQIPLHLAESLQAEVTSSLHAMRLLLLDTLHDPTRKLPAFWKAIQFLRRMQALPEDELALAFVSARLNCLRVALDNVERDAGIAPLTNGQASKIPTSSTNIEDREYEKDRIGEDVARFLKKYIDVWREGAYDLVTQYTTIFLERSLSTAAAAVQPETPSCQSHVMKQTLPSTLLALLLPTLETHLHRSYPHLGPLATQLAYCSSALARVGMDFRGLLPPLICDAVADGFTEDIRCGAKQLFSSYFVRPNSAKMRLTPPSTWLLAHPHTLPSLTAVHDASSSTDPPHILPQILTSLPPLAGLLNAYLRALNRLRLLVPVDALGRVVSAVDAALAVGAGELLECAKELSVGNDVEELQVMKAAGKAYISVLVPFIRRAIVEGVFGVSMEEWAQVAVSGSNEMVGNGHANGKAGQNDSTKLDMIVREWEGWINGNLEASA